MVPGRIVFVIVVSALLALSLVGKLTESAQIHHSHRHSALHSEGAFLSCFSNSCKNHTSRAYI